MTGTAKASSSMVDVYQQSFVRISHELLLLGHARLVATQLANLEEPDITGKLCDAMEAALDADDGPEWAPMFTVIDDQPESVAGKLGKHRPRIDVCVRCVNPRPERRFPFEAKRLHNSAALSAYLGNEGMRALVSGYYGEQALAGMIGYVQTSTCPDWTDKIKKRLKSTPLAYQLVEPVAFVELEVKAHEPIFCSEHVKANNDRRMRITHTLLLCA